MRANRFRESDMVAGRGAHWVGSFRYLATMAQRRGARLTRGGQGARAQSWRAKNITSYGAGRWSPEKKRATTGMGERDESEDDRAGLRWGRPRRGFVRPKIEQRAATENGDRTGYRMSK